MSNPVRGQVYVIDGQPMRFIGMDKYGNMKFLVVAD